MSEYPRDWGSKPPLTDWQGKPVPEVFLKKRMGKTRRNDELIANGIHPVWYKATANVKIKAKTTETCGTCDHCQVHNPGKYDGHSIKFAVYKCDRVQVTYGPGTDIRLKWPACTLWESNKTLEGK